MWKLTRLSLQYLVEPISYRLGQYPGGGWDTLLYLTRLNQTQGLDWAILKKLVGIVPWT